MFICIFPDLPYKNIFLGPNGSWFEFRCETRTGELLLKYGDQRNTKISDYKLFFLNIKNAEDSLISSFVFYCSDEISLRNIGLMRVTSRLWQNKKYKEFINKTDIPKSIKEEVDDVVQVILAKVKVTQDDEDEIFLSSKTNNIIDI